MDERSSEHVDERLGDQEEVTLGESKIRVANFARVLLKLFPLRTLNIGGPPLSPPRILTLDNDHFPRGVFD